MEIPLIRWENAKWRRLEMFRTACFPRSMNVDISKRRLFGMVDASGRLLYPNVNVVVNSDFGGTTPATAYKRLAVRFYCELGECSAGRPYFVEPRVQLCVLGSGISGAESTSRSVLHRRIDLCTGQHLLIKMLGPGRGTYTLQRITLAWSC